VSLFTDHLLHGSYPYLTPEAFIEGCPEASGASPEDDAVIDAVEDASLVVYYLTGRQFHGKRTTPIRPDCYGCGPHKIALGLWPVINIIGVHEEGIDQDPDEYHIDEYRYLVRNDGEPFPVCSNQWAETGGVHDIEENPYVFEVTVEHGMEVPRLITRATRAMACQLYQLANPSAGQCQLPERVTSIARQGVSMEVASVADNLREKGGTGIYEVDLAIEVFNPSRIQSPAFVWTPDLYRGTRRYTGTGNNTVTS
jgi:hypothetical protein